MCEVLTPRWVLHGWLSGRNVKCTNNTDPTCPWTRTWVENCTHESHVQTNTFIYPRGSLRRCSACLSIYFSSHHWKLWIGKMDRFSLEAMASFKIVHSGNNLKVWRGGAEATCDDSTLQSIWMSSWRKGGRKWPCSKCVANITAKNRLWFKLMKQFAENRDQKWPLHYFLIMKKHLQGPGELMWIGFFY